MDEASGGHFGFFEACLDLGSVLCRASGGIFGVWGPLYCGDAPRFGYRYICALFFWMPSHRMPFHFGISTFEIRVPGSFEFTQVQVPLLPESGGRGLLWLRSCLFLELLGGTCPPRSAGQRSGGCRYIWALVHLTSGFRSLSTSLRSRGFCSRSLGEGAVFGCVPAFS